MKVIIVFAAVCAVVLAAPGAPLEDSKNARIVSSKYDNESEGYKYAFEQSDGITKEEVGALKTIGKETGITARGTYSYVGKEGATYTVTYVADENGFQPVYSITSV